MTDEPKPTTYVLQELVNEIAESRTKYGLQELVNEIAESRSAVSDLQRREAHLALDVWIAECEEQGARSFARGHMGYVGRLKLRAYVNDDGVTLRIERSGEASV